MQEFQGRPINGTQAKVVGAGDGLSAPLKVDTLDLAHGDRVFVLLDCQVSDIQFPVDKNDPEAVNQKYVLQTLDAMVISGRNDKATVKKWLQTHRQRIQTALARMIEGQESLDVEV